MIEEAVKWIAGIIAALFTALVGYFMHRNKKLHDEVDMLQEHRSNDHTEIVRLSTSVDSLSTHVKSLESEVSALRETINTNNDQMKQLLLDVLLNDKHNR